MAEVVDHNYNPSEGEPKDSRVWLSLITDAQQKFRDYNDKADRIDKVYANLHRQSGKGRDREFALFWSNIQVILPSIYARTPIPVCVPRFSDQRRELTVASEFLERALVSSFDHINKTMLLVRDDLAIAGRGVAWVRYEDDKKERICFDYLHRRDFLHDPARNWTEVNWVARGAWKTFDEMKERFAKYSGDAYMQAAFQVRSRDYPDASVDPRQQALVWELWHKGENKVVWVTEGVPVVLDSGEPHLDLDGFFPCPEPAYSTTERGSLVPVPDVLYYEDQLQEIDKLTSRIHALADAIQVKGFYAAGGDIGEAVEAALAKANDSVMMIPVPNFAALGGGSGPPIVWMPIEIVAQTIQGIVELRRQIIDDVYQVIGLADIVRGATEAEETLGAQKIKRESTATRVRIKVNELVRMARDLARIAGEVMAEEFSQSTLEDMTQMDLPTKADIERDLAKLEKEAEKAAKELADGIKQKYPPQALQQNPEAGQQAQQEFAQGQQQLVAQYQPQLEALRAKVSIDAVMEILRDQKMRPFMLDIETDSTIFPDEQAEKQQRAEFMMAFSQSMVALTPLLSAGPAGAKLAGHMLKFALAPFRAGRQLEGVIDEFVERAPQEMAAQNENGKDDEGLAAAQMELAKAEMAKVQSQTEANQANAQLKMQEIQLKAAEAQEGARQAEQKFALEVEQTRGSIAETEAKIEKIYADIQLAQQKLGLEANKETREDVKAAADIQARQTDQAMAAQDQQRQAVEGDREAAFRANEAARAERGERRADRIEDRADRQQSYSERSGDRQMTLAEREAARSK